MFLAEGQSESLFYLTSSNGTVSIQVKAVCASTSCIFHCRVSDHLEHNNEKMKAEEGKKCIQHCKLALTSDV